MYAAQREWKTFAASDGSFTEQTITHVGSGIEANAIEGDEHQRRSWPDNGGGWQAAGYEYVRSLDLLGHAEEYAEEAVALLSAPQCPPGRRTIILDPSQLYMQIHESCGHPTELDRVYGTEASYAGHELPHDRQARRGLPLRLATSSRSSADATAAGGMGTFGWDDEGRRRPERAAHQGGHPQRLPHVARDGAADRPALRRGDAGRRLESHPADPDDEHQPAAGPRDEPRRHRRRHR